jgi:thiol-disulfide isomerase/thioredoxin
MPKKRKRFSGTHLALIPVALLAVIIIYLTVAPPPDLTTKTGVQTVEQGGLAPPFTLNKIDGNGLRSERFEFSPASGRVVFMDFLHEWCPHCGNMAPIIERLYSNYGGRVVFISVAGGYQTSPEKTADFIRKHNIRWTVVYDPQLEVFNKYGVRGTPTYFIIGPDGRVLAKLEGEQPYERLAQELERALS